MSTVLLCYYGVWPAVVRTADGGRPAHSHFHISTQTTRHWEDVSSASGGLQTQTLLANYKTTISPVHISHPHAVVHGRH